MACAIRPARQRRALGSLVLTLAACGQSGRLDTDHAPNSVVPPGSGGRPANRVGSGGLAAQVAMDPDAAAAATPSDADAKVDFGATPVRVDAPRPMDRGLVADSALVLTAPPIVQGTGGPIVVITRAGANQFGSYYADILRAEGLNAFRVIDLGSLTQPLLAAFDVALLAETTDTILSAREVALLTGFVEAGGNLIAMRPDPGLASLFGTKIGGKATAGYFKIDTAQTPGQGLTPESMQFHGDATALTPLGSGTRVVAALCAASDFCGDAAALTLRTNVGAGGGKAAAVAFDVARSVVLTRQGNPDLQGQDTDKDGLVRAEDMFRNGWLDMDKVRIPQADEVQRLLVNLIVSMNMARRPLPRFWYLPQGRSVAILMSADDHNANGTKGMLDALKAPALSPPGCTVSDWNCARSTSLVFHQVSLSVTERSAYAAMGFEFGTHMALKENDGACTNANETAWRAAYTARLTEFATKYSGLPAQTTTRVHCIATESWDTHAQLALANGLRIDMNYYYWPPGWARERVGHFTGGGLPMRFVRFADRSVVDVYQTVTHYSYETFVPPTGVDAVAYHRRVIDQWISDADKLGYVAIIGTHYDFSAASAPMEKALRDAAADAKVALVSGQQVAQWLDGRNGSSFQDISWAQGRLRFKVETAPNTTGIMALLPVDAIGVGAQIRISRGGTVVPHQIKIIKGVRSAMFPAPTGAYEAVYTP